RRRLRLGFPVSGKDMLDYLVLKHEYVLVTDVSRLVRKTTDELGNFEAVFLNLVRAGVDVAPKMTPAFPGTGSLEVKNMPQHFSRRNPEWIPLGNAVSTFAPSLLSNSFNCLRSISGRPVLPCPLLR